MNYNTAIQFLDTFLAIVSRWNISSSQKETLITKLQSCLDLVASK